MAPRGSRRSGRKATSASKKKEADQESRETSATPVDEDSNDVGSAENSKSASDEMESENGESDGSEGTSSDEDTTPVTLMVNERMKRATAGNKMAALLTNADHEDEFYKTAYGGFEENNEADREYESPVHSDEDDVDSDFDKPEEEDEPVSGGENDDERPRKRRKFKEPKRGLTADDVLAKNKKWAMARLAGNLVEANSVDEKTQTQLLKEAEKTEKLNIESLKKYEEIELEKKKKRGTAATRVFPPGPREQIKITREEITVTVSEIKKFQCGRPKPTTLCAVTGRPARYFDPITELPYSTPYAFKVIRDKYNKFLKEIDGNDAVKEYLRQQLVFASKEAPNLVSATTNSSLAVAAAAEPSTRPQA